MPICVLTADRLMTPTTKLLSLMPRFLTVKKAFPLQWNWLVIGILFQSQMRFSKILVSCQWAQLRMSGLPPSTRISSSFYSGFFGSGVGKAERSLCSPGQQLPILLPNKQIAPVFDSARSAENYFLTKPTLVMLILISLQQLKMNNSPALVLSLQEYIVELETENRSLKQHIFQLQEKLEGSSSIFHDEIQKLKLYIDHCQNEIIKRENREVGLLELVAEMELAKEDICKERDIYIQQIDDLRREVQARQDDIGRLQRQEEVFKASLSLQNKNCQNLPPKGSKCRNCEAYIKNQQVLQQHVAQREQTIRRLQGDLQCLREFI